MAEKITQTAGRNSLGEFAPEFAHFNDDVLSVRTGTTPTLI
jgi:4-carboxymuconolactone decarboxylase